MSGPSTGACIGVFLCGAIAPSISAPGVAPTLSASIPEVLGRNDEIISDYLVNSYLLSFPGKFLTDPVKIRTNLGGY